MTKRLLTSFSGGRTSAYMTKRLLDELPPSIERMVVFANTGQEHEATLSFVDQCDRVFGFGVIWLEAMPDPQKGKSTKGVVTNYAAASRKGEPFERVIRKYGLPNVKFPHCTRELKERPIRNYLRGVGWGPNTYDTAIGIRADEIDRMAADAREQRIIYPLVKWGVTKRDVVEFWQKAPFNLAIPEHLGNCTWCWKKSLRKHLTLAKDHPEVFRFPARMEQLYRKEQQYTLFRGNRTTQDILRLAEQPFEVFSDPTFDLNAGCSENCEAFG